MEFREVTETKASLQQSIYELHAFLVEHIASMDDLSVSQDMHVDNLSLVSDIESLLFDATQRPWKGTERDKIASIYGEILLKIIVLFKRSGTLPRIQSDLSGGLTEQQAKAMLFINQHITEKGFSPSYDEIRAALELKSKSGIARIIDALVDRGFVSKSARSGKRSLQIIRLPINTTQKDQ